jgi:hypothetical protein
VRCRRRSRAFSVPLAEHDILVLAHGDGPRAPTPAAVSVKPAYGAPWHPLLLGRGRRGR